MCVASVSSVTVLSAMTKSLSPQQAESFLLHHFSALYHRTVGNGFFTIKCKKLRPHGFAGGTSTLLPQFSTLFLYSALNMGIKSMHRVQTMVTMMTVIMERRTP